MFTSTIKSAAKTAVLLCLIWLLTSCTVPPPTLVEPTVTPTSTVEADVATLTPTSTVEATVATLTPTPTDEAAVATLTPTPTDEPAPLETPLPPDESVSRPFEDEEWSGSYAEAPSELCPTEPDATEGAIEESVSRPVFESEPHQQDGAWVQRGLYANRQGEVFALVVSGFGNNSEYVSEYTGNIKVCLDRLIPESAPNIGALPDLDFGDTIDQPAEEDLLITFEFVGGNFTGDNGWLQERASNDAQFRTLSIEDEGDIFTSALTLFEQDQRASVIDFVYDPDIRLRATHVYLDHGSVRSKTTDVWRRYGNVRAKRCTPSSLGVRGVMSTSGYWVRGRGWYDRSYVPGRRVIGCDPW